MLQMTRSAIGLAVILLLMGVTSVAAGDKIRAGVNPAGQMPLAAGR